MLTGCSNLGIDELCLMPPSEQDTDASKHQEGRLQGQGIFPGCRLSFVGAHHSIDGTKAVNAGVAEGTCFWYRHLRRQARRCER